MIFMLSENVISKQDIDAMREIGKSMLDHGFMELNTLTGVLTWCNEFALQKHGFTQDQLLNMSVFELVPIEFHETIKNIIYDINNGKNFKFSVGPIKTSKGKLVWWYSIKLATKSNYSWFRSEYIDTTDHSGPEYAYLASLMYTTNEYNDLSNKINEFQVWTEEAIDRLEKKNSELETKINTVYDDLKQTKKFAETAANAGLEIKQSMIHFQNGVSDEMSKQTSEIMRLISTDIVHSKRMETFESHVKQATQTAMKAITARANEAGSGLTRKVTIPVGAIAAAAAVVQWLMQHLPF